MHRLLQVIWLLTFVSIGCGSHGQRTKPNEVSAQETAYAQPEIIYGALLSTRYQALDELKGIVDIQYAHPPQDTSQAWNSYSVTLTCKVYGQSMTSVLTNGISEDDFLKARRGTLVDKLTLGIRCPFAVMHRIPLMVIENLGRRRPWEFGKGDVAFYDLAEYMVMHIREEYRSQINPVDLTEKGYLNTFNHITAQAFMTSMYSEEVADFVADVHERHNLPELITGRFTEAQLRDPAEGPVDNYIDMLNNEWGQELGQALQSKYAITPEMYWTPELLADYLNEVQSYYSWRMHIGFIPFRPTDEIVVRFASKMNLLLDAYGT